MILTRLGVTISQGPDGGLFSYSYDVGFLFAGECRVAVELVNDMLKDEDVITFYDFDQQAALLGQDLEGYLDRVYAKQCRYYLVFVDRQYRDKVWTKFERDVMTRSGRKGHIIPIILEKGVNLVGVPSTVGHIDLSEAWRLIQGASMKVSSDERNYIKNRCVLPLLEKLSSDSSP